MSEFPVLIDRVVTLLDDGTYADVWQQRLAESDVLLLEIDVGDVKDGRAFFERAAQALRIETSVRSWDGFEDYLWGRLGESTAEHAMIVLRHVETMATDTLGDLLEAVSLFRDLIQRTGPDRSSFPRDIELRLVLTGQGASFPTP
jgi:Barstar (barnase inhibitor)